MVPRVETCEDGKLYVMFLIEAKVKMERATVPTKSDNKEMNDNVG